MRLIVIGSERRLFSEGSSARERIASFGPLFEDVRIIVFTGRESKFVEQDIAPNVRIYPTRSWSRVFYLGDVVSVARKIFRDTAGAPPLDGATVVSAQDPFESGLAAFRIAPIFSAKVHLQVHTDFLSPQFRKTFLNAWRARVARRIIPKADAVRVVLDGLRERMVAAGLCARERTAVLPIFTDPEKYALDAPVSPEADLRRIFPRFNFIVLMASRLTGEKNVGLGIAAFAPIVRQDSGAGMVVVGEGPDEHRIRSLARELGVAERVAFLPWQQDMSSIYRTANVFLLTSEFEGYGLTLLEAAASGLPIVTTAVGLASEFKDGSEALVCPVGDRECLTEALSRTLNDHGLYQVLRTRGRLAALPRLPSRDEYLAQYKAAIELSLSAG